MATRYGSLFLTLALAAQAARLPVSPGTPPPAGFADLVEKSIPSVVRILTEKREEAASGPAANTASSAGRAKGKRVGGEGSGVIVTAGGHILTNQHVVEGADKITVQLADDREFVARVVAADAPTDLAVLKVEAGPLTPMAFGDSSRLRVGDYVLAIGNPFGVGTTVTQGIVSAMSPGGGEDLIQTDAAINPGNSGGPLLNMSGELVGINTAIISPSGGSNGIGLAIPASVARRALTQLMADGHVKRGYLGVGLQPMSSALTEALNAPRSGGALITDVAPESPAFHAGLLKSDVVLALNGRALRDFQRLRFYIVRAQPGDVLRLTVARDGVEQTLAVSLKERPLQPAGPPSPQEAPGLAQTGLLPGAVVADLNDDSRRALNLDPGRQGALVTAVNPDGESAEAGLRPGDVIVFVNKQPVVDAGSLAQRLAAETDKPALLEISRRDGTCFVALPRL